ncbi:DUF4329 domain-containing protein [Pseudomonas fluorescens]|uniref:DUF4329 domain-containing protein n=1 Tax=Pseudomonas fluorescens TaxID=294 RepID=UPI003C19AB85
MNNNTDRENARKMLEQLATLPLEQPAKAAPVLPPVSPPFICEDDAAYWVHQHERLNDREYGALILQRPDGKFVATTPIQGEATSFDMERLLNYDRQTQTISHPAGYLCVGKWHSHPDIYKRIAKANPTFNSDQVKLFNALPSMSDVHGAFNHRDFFKHSYVSDLSGSLVAYSINPPDSAYSPVFRMATDPKTWSEGSRSSVTCVSWSQAPCGVGCVARSLLNGLPTNRSYPGLPNSSRFLRAFLKTRPRR